MTVAKLEALWNGPLSEIRYGRYLPEHDRAIRDLLNEITPFEEAVPIGMARNLWFMPMFLEWQHHRVEAVAPTQLVTYNALCAWVLKRVGELLGDP